MISLCSVRRASSNFLNKLKSGSCLSLVPSENELDESVNPGLSVNFIFFRSMPTLGKFEKCETESEYPLPIELLFLESDRRGVVSSTLSTNVSRVFLIILEISSAQGLLYL